MTGWEQTGSLARVFHRIGRDMFLAGLNSSHSGNMSARWGDRIMITRTGAALGRLSAGDLVEVPLDAGQDDVAEGLHPWPPGPGVQPSSELVVHRAVYLAVPAGAVVHAHPPHAVALSLAADTLVPADTEGALILGPVPVVTARRPAGSAEVAALVAAALRERPLVLVRGHGSFALGDDLEEAYHRTAALEHSARIACIHRMLGGGR